MTEGYGEGARPHGNRVGLTSSALAFFVLSGVGLLAPVAWADEGTGPSEQFLEVPLEKMLSMKIATPSLRPQEVREVPATTYVVTEEDFRTYGYRDLKDILRNLPGVEYIYPHSHVFGGQRGLSSFLQETKLLINGWETNVLSDNEAFIANQFLLTGVKRVEIVQGPASVLYGPEAFTGVINIITKDAENSSEGSELTGIVGGGDKSSLDSNGAFYTVAKRGPMNLAVGARLDASRGPDFTDFVKTPEYSDVNRDKRTFFLEHGNPYRDKNRNSWWNADLAYSPTSRVQVKAGAFYWRAQEGGGIEFPNLSFTNDEVIYEQTHFYVSGTYQFATVPVKSTLFYHYILENFWTREQATDTVDENLPLLAAFNFEGSKLNVVNLQVDYAPRFIDNYFLAGIGTRDTQVGDPAFTGNSPTDTTPTQPVSLVGHYLYPPTGYFSDLQLHQNRIYLYAQDQQSLWNNKVQITAGIRWDRNNVYGSVLNVRSGILLRPVANYTIRGFFGQGFREPTVVELSHNPNLVPARMNAWEVSLLATPLRYFSGQVAYFQNRASKLIVLQCAGAATPSSCGPQNVGEKRVAGVEALLRYQISPFGGDLWYSYEYALDDQPLSGTASNKLGFGGHYDYREHLSLALRARWTSRARGSALDAERNQISITVPQYFTLDLNALARNYAFAGVNWDVSFSIFNILGRGNFYVNAVTADPGRYLAEGREYFGRVSIHF